jgi:hypothetical protein
VCLRRKHCCYLSMPNLPGASNLSCYQLFCQTVLKLLPPARLETVLRL